MLYSDQAVDSDHAQAIAEAFAEGCVQANMETIERNPDAFPCCCACGDFTLDAVRVSPPTQVLRNLSVGGAQTLSGRKHGNALELACFQAAQRRLEGDPGAKVEISMTEDGMLECVVVRSNGEIENMDQFTPQPLHGFESVPGQPQRNCGACGCSAEQE